MKPKPHSEQLLDDILEEGTTPAFRAGLLEAMLQHARRRRHSRSRIRAILIAGIFVGAAVMGLRWRRPNSPTTFSKITSPSSASSVVVSSLPLRSSMVVKTRPASVSVVHSAPDTVIKISSAEGQKPFREISDADLFTLLAGRPVALVRQQGHPVELLFLNPADRDGFTVR